VPGLTDFTRDVYGDDVRAEPTFSHG
jgi:nitrogen fixation protein NifB